MRPFSVIHETMMIKSGVWWMALRFGRITMRAYRYDVAICRAWWIMFVASANRYVRSAASRTCIQSTYNDGHHHSAVGAHRMRPFPVIHETYDDEIRCLVDGVTFWAHAMTHVVVVSIIARGLPCFFMLFVRLSPTPRTIVSNRNARPSAR